MLSASFFSRTTGANLNSDVNEKYLDILSEQCRKTDGKISDEVIKKIFTPGNLFRDQLNQALRVISAIPAARILELTVFEGVCDGFIAMLTP